MKAKLNTANIYPITINLTIENENELRYLWHIFNLQEDSEELRENCDSDDIELWEEGSVNSQSIWDLLDKVFH